MPSWYRNNFSTIDWVGTLTVLGFFAMVASIWVSSEITKATSELRVDFAKLSTETTLRQEQLLEAFADLRSELNTVVETGLQERSDELGSALMAGMAEATAYTLRVANVPQDSVTWSKLRNISDTLGGETRVMNIADKAIFEFDFANIDDEKIAAVKAALEMSKDPSIKVDVQFSPSDWGANFEKMVFPKN